MGSEMCIRDRKVSKRPSEKEDSKQPLSAERGGDCGEESPESGNADRDTQEGEEHADV